MLRRLTVASALALASACSTTPSAGAAKGPTQVQEQMRITNQAPFDVAVCHPRTLKLAQPVNQGLLVGALVAVRPQIMECLVDPKSRGTADTTKVTVKSSATPEGASHTVTGENLTPEGQSCVQKVVDTQVPLAALPKGAQPVESQSEFIHEAGNSASVKFGINDGSDFSGAVRLGQIQWCECYADFADKSPPLLKATVHLAKSQAKPSAVTFDPVGTPEGDKLAACLQAKMAELPAKLSSDELKFPHRFIHFHSLAVEPAADLTPELRFFQLELTRGQRSADAAMAFGERLIAADVYDALVNKYKKTKDWKLVTDLKSKCNELGQAAQKWVSALEGQLKVDEATLATVKELIAKDASWAAVEPKSLETVEATRQDLASAQKRLGDDKAICPKER